MSEPDYKALLEVTFTKLVELVRQRSDLDAEVGRLTQFIHATANMVPDEERKEILGRMAGFLRSHASSDASLADSIRRVLRECRPEFLTVAQVRDRLMASGFDFTGYVSNPLASVSTTLARMKRSEVEMKTIDGVAAYRWSRGLAPPPDLEAEGHFKEIERVTKK